MSSSNNVVSAGVPSGYLLNLLTRDVVPANPELCKEISTGRFRRLTPAEAQRRLNGQPSAPVSVAAVPKPKLPPGVTTAMLSEVTEEQIEAQIELLKAALATKRATPDPVGDDEPPQGEDVPDNDDQEEEDLGTEGDDKKVDPAVMAQINEALARAEAFRVADDKEGLDAMAADEFSIKLNRRNNIHKMMAAFRAQLGDTFGVEL